MTSREWAHVRQHDISHEHPEYEKLFSSSLSAGHLNRYSDIMANEATLFPTAKCGLTPKYCFSELAAAQAQATATAASGSNSASASASSSSSAPIDYPYLNANVFMPDLFHKCPHTFVACQSPTPRQIYGFWLTVLAYEVPLIVMLTRLKEAKRVKADPYWPNEVGQVVEFKGTGLSLELISVYTDEKKQTTIRKIRVSKLGKSGEVSHTVDHVHYCGWSDYSVPDDDEAFMNLVNLCETADTQKGPIIIHCSAGIGRTGTLMGTYYGRHLLRSTAAAAIDDKLRSAVIDIVCNMKKTRSGMVQKMEQMQYLLKCLGFP